MSILYHLHVFKNTNTVLHTSIVKFARKFSQLPFKSNSIYFWDRFDFLLSPVTKIYKSTKRYTNFRIVSMKLRIGKRLRKRSGSELHKHVFYNCHLCCPSCTVNMPWKLPIQRIQLSECRIGNIVQLDRSKRKINTDFKMRT